MAAGLDELEIRDPAARERELFARLGSFMARAVERAPGLAAHLAGHDLTAVASREALAKLPVLRKSELMERQAENPPFGGFAPPEALRGNRVFLSPGPLWEPQAHAEEAVHVARAFRAAGFTSDDVIHNGFSYHMTPGAFLLEAGALALGAAVFPAGTGNTEMQVDAAAQLKPTGYCGTPDFLKILLDRAAESGRDLSSIKRALVSGGALFPSLRDEYRTRGVSVAQCYATAEFGVIAYEVLDGEGNPLPGMIVNENLIVEIVRPGTDDPVDEGEVGEVVVTSFNANYPLVRLGTGDLSAILPGISACGRTGLRIKGWMGRADQRTKVKGMFVDPRQIGDLMRRHGELARARLVVSRAGDADAMTLHVEARDGQTVDAATIAATLRETTKLGGTVEVAAPGSLPNDGKIIADERDYKA